MALFILCMQVGLLHVGQHLIVPILPLYAESFGISTVMIGLLLTLQSVPRVFANVPAGRFADRFGAHRVLLLACAFGTASAITGAAANGFLLLLASRVIQGLGSAVSSTAGLTYAASLGSEERRGRRISLYQGAFLAGNGIGPVIGGTVAQRLGYRAPFMVYAVLALVAGLWVWLKLPDPRDRPHDDEADEDATADGEGEPAARRPKKAGPQELLSSRHQLMAMLTSAGITLACFMGFVAAFDRSGSRNFALILLVDEQGVPESRIGLVLTVIFLSNVAVLYLAGWLVDRYGAKIVLVPGWVLLGVGLVLMAGAETYAGLLGAATLYGVGGGIGSSVPAMYIAAAASAEDRGLALGLYRTFNDVGLILGPLLMGWLVVALGVSSGIRVNAGLVLLAALLFLFAGPAGRRRDDA